MTLTSLMIWAVVAYLFGSIPSGYVLVKMFLKQDVRNVGSGNIGATNVLRAGGKHLALVTYVLDIVKIWIPMLLFGWIMNPLNDLPADIYQAALMIIGAMGVLGHMYSCWLKFDGGKGVASFTAYALWLFPYGSVVGVIIFAIVAFSTKIVSLASLLGVGAVAMYTVIYIFPVLDTPMQLMAAAKISFLIIVLLIFWRHKGNIMRLIQGKENKIKL
jgi:glycerol-3-phosphate acyltransferase PlsY